MKGPSLGQPSESGTIAIAQISSFMMMYYRQASIQNGPFWKLK